MAKATAVTPRVAEYQLTLSQDEALELCGLLVGLDESTMIFSVLAEALDEVLGEDVLLDTPAYERGVAIVRSLRED